MTPKAIEYLERVRTSFWFIPGLMTLAAGFAAFATIHLDNALKEKLVERIGLLYAGGPEGARAVLAAIAGSMITVAGVVFSVMIVMLSLASQQFGPRILRSFIRDRSNQFVLGSFVSTFVYCLFVLRTVRGSDSSEFVPYISVTAGILMAVLSIGVLIFFVHHAAASIQASSIIAAVGGEIDEAIDRLYPEQIGDGDPHSKMTPQISMHGKVISSSVTGYVQFIDGDALLQRAAERDVLIEVTAAPGSFVRPGDSLAKVHSEAPVHEPACDDLRSAFKIGDNRTSTQDIDYLFRQLTEIAVRALSPGTNDPFTALEVLDRLGAALSRLAGREIPSRVRRDKKGAARLIASPTDFTSLAQQSLGSIRRYGETHEEVLIRVLGCIRDSAPYIRRSEDRVVLEQEASRTLAVADRWKDEWARRHIQEEFTNTIVALREVKP